MALPEVSASTSGPRVARRGEPLAGTLFALALLLILVFVLGTRLVVLGGLPPLPLTELAFWAVLIIIMNLVPFESGELTFTLDTPLLLTIALLYPPEVAAIVGFVGGLDVRELQRGFGPIRALFNRTQIALSVLSAALVFRLVTDGALEPWTKAAFGTTLAVLAFHAVNGITVGVHSAARGTLPLGNALRSLTVGPMSSFLATYFGYGVLALVLAHLFLEVGAWSVALFLIPMLVARQMLVRGAALTQLTTDLRQRERLLERLFDQIVEERRDERLRIAAGLHDDVMQSLIRMSQLGSFLKKELPRSGQPGRDAKELYELSHETSDKLRHVLSDLQRSPLGKGGLVPTLTGLIADLQTDWDVVIDLAAEKDLVLSPEIQLVGYQGIREAIMNSLKHSGASRVRVSLRSGSGGFIGLVEDEGCGFDPSLVDEAQHFGLGLMRTRTELAGGEIKVESQPEKGTRVTITLPDAKDDVLEPGVGVSEIPNGARPKLT